ncbi:MAG: hypothetical protein JNK72_01745 [Myxococcales bacterium]|nr:hypothetical protein [Myxococcales bacterium]
MEFRAIYNPGLPVRLRAAGLDVAAFAVSGFASYVLVPGVDLCFDLGHCGVEAAGLRNVFLSHVHQDHAGGVARHVSLRRMFGGARSKIVCPAESADALAAFLRAADALEEKCAEADPAEMIRGVLPGDTVALGRRYTVTAFDVAHRIASRGYTLVEHRRRLKPAYRELPGEALAEARARGEDLYDVHSVNILTYVGDSTLATLEARPEIFESEAVFVEATHLPPTEKAASARWGHTHWDDLIAWLEAHLDTMACQQIIVKHFSMKYRPHDLREVHRKLPPRLRGRVTMLMHGVAEET